MDHFARLTPLVNALGELTLVNAVNALHNSLILQDGGVNHDR
jgi:hypothetical protein